MASDTALPVKTVDEDEDAPCHSRVLKKMGKVVYPALEPHAIVGRHTGRMACCAILLNACLFTVLMVYHMVLACEEKIAMLDPDWGQSTYTYLNTYYRRVASSEIFLPMGLTYYRDEDGDVVPLEDLADDDDVVQEEIAAGSLFVEYGEYDWQPCHLSGISCADYYTGLEGKSFCDPDLNCNEGGVVSVVSYECASFLAAAGLSIGYWVFVNMFIGAVSVWCIAMRNGVDPRVRLSRRAFVRTLNPDTFNYEEVELLRSMMEGYRKGGIGIEDEKE